MRPVNAARTINYIGRSNWNDAFFEGGIYRIAFYNKALTGSEVAQNYSSMIDTSWPTINGSGSYNVYETSTAVTSLTSSESVLFYEKNGSGDSGSLSITTNGVVTFDFLPNYENYSPNQIFSYYVNVLDANGNYSTNILTLTLRDVAEFATISFNSISAPPIKGVPVTLTITPSAGTTSGKVTYLVNGKRIPNCYKRTFTGSGNSTCSWKPANRGWQELTITFTPNGSEYGPATLNKSYFVNKRTTIR